MKIFIYGCGGHARSVGGILKESGIEAIFIDENARDSEKILGFKVIKPEEHCGEFNYYAIGDNSLRKKLFEQNNEKLLNIIAKTAFIGGESEINVGTYIGNYVNIGVQAKIGFNCIINTAAVVEHEVLIGNHSSLGPGAVICGRSSVGENVMIGAGATIIDKISICDDVIIGAGAVVVNNIFEKGTYLGVPAVKKDE